MPPQKIGELNGGWSLLFKVALGTLPMLLLWIAWATVAIVQIQSNRFTAEDAFELSTRLEAKMPPRWVEDKLRDNADRTTENSKRITRLETGE